MSIQSEINRIVNARDSSFTAVAAKGVTVPSNSTIDDLPGLIEEIQGIPSLQSKSVEPLESIQIVTADSAYDGLSSVTVDAIPSDYVGSNIPRWTSAALTADGSIVVALKGYYPKSVSKAVDAGALTINSSTIIANPIISLNSSTGVVTATVNNNISVGATLTSGYISNYISGTVEASGSNTFQLTTKSAATYTPNSLTQAIASGQYLTGAQTIAGDSNLIADNIRNGTTIFGVSGTFGPDDIIIIGDYGLCFNNFSVSSNTCISEAGTVSGNTLIAV